MSGDPKDPLAPAPADPVARLAPATFVETPFQRFLSEFC